MFELKCVLKRCLHILFATFISGIPYHLIRYHPGLIQSSLPDVLVGSPFSYPN